MPLPLDPHAFHRIVFFTGAGLSAESGLPTYRGKGGVWPRTDFRRYACQDAFERDPEQVWEFHLARRERMGAAQPSQAHAHIAHLARSHPCVTVVTQNIDGLHQRAGCTDVVELHGSIWRVRCPCTAVPRLDPQGPPGSRRCPGCAGWLRPDIVWFGDRLDESVWRAATRAIQACDLFVSIGTSAAVMPAAALPELARRVGATTLEINPEETPNSALYDLHLRQDATPGLRAALQP